MLLINIADSYLNTNGETLPYYKITVKFCTYRVFSYSSNRTDSSVFHSHDKYFKFRMTYSFAFTSQ